MVEALDLFEQIVNSHHFGEVQIMLFLNKRDLFADKIEKVDPAKWFPDYKGGCDYKRAEAYFKQAFEKRIHDAKSRELYMHTTCATDTENIASVFNAISLIMSAKGASTFLGQDA